MKTPNPIDLLFADMDKLSPGDDSLSRYVLRSLPEHRFGIVVDAGCGAGRQTLVLADELRTEIHAVDSYQPFLDRLRQLQEVLTDIQRKITTAGREHASAFNGGRPDNASVHHTLKMVQDRITPRRFPHWRRCTPLHRAQAHTVH